MRLKGVIALACVAGMGFVTGCGQDDGAKQGLADQVAPQLRYLDPDASLVASVDLRYHEQNGKRLRRLVDDGLEAYRELEPDDSEIPEDVDAALELAARETGLSAEDDLKPALDGHLVVGLTVRPGDVGADFDRSDGPTPETTTVWTYRSESGGLEKVAKKLAGEGRARKVPGHPDAQQLGDSAALVDDDTIVVVDSDRDAGAGLRAALDRAERDRGFPARDLQRAADRAEGDEPFVVATGNLDLGGLLVSDESLDRARREVPLLAATTGASAVLELGDDRLTGKLRMDTGGARLSETDLPVGPPGDVDLPDRGDAIVGGSRDQSVTTAFATRLARSLFADSQFVRAVERTERKLGIDFEKEFLQQFDCPSISVFEGAGGGRFAARSCVSDPARMRRLLPRLAPELPAILTGLQRLPSEGLVALLLIAPDAPLTPSFGDLLGAVTLDRLRGGGGGADDREQLYELRGLRDPETRLAVQGPDRVVFGMIGDAFVVGSDRAALREVAKQKTRRADARAASVTRVPMRLLAPEGADGGELEVKLLDRLFGDLELSGSARRDGVDLGAGLPVEDR